ncbi:type 2 periplasmic-binding domain-containing protein [Halovulum sp. GXIMD14793]
MLHRRSFLRTTGLGLAGTLAAPAILRAQPLQLSMADWAAPRIGENMGAPWREEIERLTDGRVVINAVPPPGPPPAMLDFLQENKLDVSYSIHGYEGPDHFLRARVGQFSFLGDGYSASQAFNKVYGKLLDGWDEHTEFNVETLGVFQHGPGVLMLRNKEIRGPEDYAGLKLRVPGGYISNLLQDLGVEPIPTSPTEVRDKLQSGEIDGVAFPVSGANAFKSVDQITSVAQMPGGYYNATFFMAMSKSAAERIGPADMEIIRNYSRQTLHVLAAKAFDYDDYLEEQVLRDRGVTFFDADDAHIAFIKEKADAYEKKWAEQVAAQGYQGEKALAFTRRLTSGA